MRADLGSTDLRGDERSFVSEPCSTQDPSAALEASRSGNSTLNLEAEIRDQKLEGGEPDIWVR